MLHKERLAKIVRILSTPPLLAVALLIVSAVQRPETFSTWVDFAVSLACLGIFPLLAYPLAHKLPATEHMGREGERKLAFTFCLLGYTILVVYGVAFRQNPQLMLIYETYFFSGGILAVLNAVFHVRASGHACGATGPVLLAGCLLGWQWSLPFALPFVLSAWASIILRRHTGMEYFTGSVCCVVGFFLAWLLAF